MAQELDTVYAYASLFRNKKFLVSPSTFDQTVSTSWTLDRNNFFTRVNTTGAPGVLITLPPIGYVTSYHILEWSNVVSSLLRLQPGSNDSVNGNGAGNYVDFTGSGLPTLILLLGENNNWRVGFMSLTNTVAATTITAGAYISVTGTPPNYTIINTAPDQTITLTSGTGISATGTYPNFTVTNTAPDQVVSLMAGANVSVSGTYPSFTIAASTGTATTVSAGTSTSITGTPPNYIVNNTAPDQVVSLASGTGISATGTYPNFTVTNTAPDQTVAITAGTGITKSGAYPNFTITNSAPDQTVTLTAGSNITITGSYPNFTITAAAGMSTKYLKADTTTAASFTYSGANVLYTPALTFSSTSGDFTNSGSGVLTYTGTPANFAGRIRMRCTGSTASNQPYCNLFYNGVWLYGTYASPAGSTGAFDVNEAIGNFNTASVQIDRPITLFTNDTLTIYMTNGIGSSTTASNFQLSVYLVQI